MNKRADFDLLALIVDEQEITAKIVRKGKEIILTNWEEKKSPIKRRLPFHGFRQLENLLILLIQQLVVPSSYPTPELNIKNAVRTFQ